MKIWQGRLRLREGSGVRRFGGRRTWRLIFSGTFFFPHSFVDFFKMNTDDVDRLILEYARIMSPDRDAMSYKTAKEQGKA